MSRHSDRNVGAALRAAVLDQPYLCGQTIAGTGCGDWVPSGHCHLCHRPGAITLDHLLPVSLGGRSVADNLRPAHHSCNSRRQATGMARAQPHLIEPW